MAEQTLTFRIAAVDGLTSVMERAADRTKAAMSRISQSVSGAMGAAVGSSSGGIAGPIQSALRMVSKVTSPIVGAITAALRGLWSMASSAVARTTELFKGLASHAWGVAQAVGGITTKVLALGAGAATAIGGLAVRSFLQAASAMEGFRAKLQVAMKDNGLAEGMLAWAERLSMVVPFSLESITDAITRLQLYGISATEWFTSIGNMAGAMSRDVTDAVEAVADALRGEWERIKEFGINSAQLVPYGAKRGGQGVDSSTPEGLNALRVALKAFMDDRFAGGMTKLMTTMRGMASNLQVVVFQIRTALGQALAPAYKRIITTLTEFGSQLVPLFRSWQKPIADFLDGLVKKGIEALPKLTEKLKPAMDWLKRFGSGLSEWFKDQGGWAGLWERVRNFGTSLWKVVTTLIGPAFQWMVQVAANAITAIQRWLAQNGGIENLIMRIGALFNVYLRPALAYFIERLREAMQILGVAFGFVAQQTGGLEGVFQSLSAWIVTIANYIPWIADQFAQFSTVTIPKLTSALDQLGIALNNIVDRFDLLAQSRLGGWLGLQQATATSGTDTSGLEASLPQVDMSSGARARRFLFGTWGEERRSIDMHIKLERGLVAKTNNEQQYRQEFTFSN